MSRNAPPKGSVGGALRDSQKTAVKEKFGASVDFFKGYFIDNQGLSVKMTASRSTAAKNLFSSSLSKS